MEDHGGEKNFRRTREGHSDLEANRLTAGAECVKALQSIEACKRAILNLCQFTFERMAETRA